MRSLVRLAELDWMTLVGEGEGEGVWKGSVRDACLLFAISSDHVRDDHPSRSCIEEMTGQRLDGRTSS